MNYFRSFKIFFKIISKYFGWFIWNSTFMAKQSEIYANIYFIYLLLIFDYGNLPFKIQIYTVYWLFLYDIFNFLYYFMVSLFLTLV